MSIDDTSMAKSSLRSFIRTAMKAPFLEQEEELGYARKWREDGCEKSLHQLTQPYMRLVVSMASKFRTYGLPMTDLVQEGMVGLMQAAARFEPEREVRFSTYASWWIRSSLQDFVLRNWSIVRTGTTAAQKSLFFNLRRLQAKIDGVGTHVSPEARTEIARQLRTSENDVDAMAGRLTGSDRSLNARIGEDGESEWQDFLADERAAPEEEVMLSKDAETRSRWLNAALQGLTERELIIIRERRLGEDTVTLANLGKRLGLSKERVRQIEHQALNKLRTALEPRVREAELI